MEFINQYQWHLFITIEVLFIVTFLAFGVFRYVFNKRTWSIFFLVSFVILIAIEAFLALIVYFITGEIGTFQIVIIIFILYALTFGIIDFINLDRWMRRKIGSLRGIELLTEKDYYIMERNKDPKYVTRKYRITSTTHLIIFIIVQSIFWSYGTDSFAELLYYLTDLSWIENGSYESSPYPNETIYSIGTIWAIILLIDLIWSWSYTFFPSKKNTDS